LVVVVITNAILSDEDEDEELAELELNETELELKLVLDELAAENTKVSNHPVSLPVD
jgi:hypothetical protein